MNRLISPAHSSCDPSLKRYLMRKCFTRPSRDGAGARLKKPVWSAADPSPWTGERERAIVARPRLARPKTARLRAGSLKINAEIGLRRDRLGGAGKPGPTWTGV